MTELRLGQADTEQTSLTIDSLFAATHNYCQCFSGAFIVMAGHAYISGITDTIIIVESEAAVFF